MTDTRKLYVDTAFGQLHVRQCAPQGEERHPPLVCLHPAPSSGMYFDTALPMLAKGRRVIAPDYPGYGGSARQESPLTIADYARAINEILQELLPNESADLLGFHTGCLVAAEMLHARPQPIRRAVLCDIPYFTPEQQDGLRDKMAQPLPVSADFDDLKKAWDFNIASRVEHVPLPRAYDLLAEHLRAGAHDWFAFDAAFRYDCEVRFAAIDADVVCLATQSALHAPTMAAANAIPNARVVDVSEVDAAVFEAGAEAISKRILAALE